MTDEFWRNLPATIAAIGVIISLVVQYMNSKKLNTVHNDMNGKLAELVKEKEKSAFTAGGEDARSKADAKAADVAQGVATEKAREKGPQS